MVLYTHVLYLFFMRPLTEYLEIAGKILRNFVNFLWHRDNKAACGHTEVVHYLHTLQESHFVVHASITAALYLWKILGSVLAHTSVKNFFFQL